MDIQEISDRLEIRDLITRYTRAVDTRSFDDLDHVFTDDAILDYSTVDGPVALLAEARAWVVQGLAGFKAYQHTIGQVDIRLDGDSARATAYFINPLIMDAGDGTDAIIEVGGYYHHELVRTPDGWRSARMTDEVVYTKT